MANQSNHINVDVNTPLGLVLTMLEGLITAVKVNSSIPPQLSELRTMKSLLLAEYMSKSVSNWQAIDGSPRTIEPRKMGIYPTMQNLGSVIDLAMSQLPGVPANVIMTLFMTYHNTLLHNLEQETNYVPRKG